MMANSSKTQQRSEERGRAGERPGPGHGPEDHAHPGAEGAVARSLRHGAAALQPQVPREPARLPHPGTRLRRPEARDTVERLQALGEQLDGGNVAIRRTRVDDRPIAGTRLIREWQGVEHCVTVLADGFE